MGAPVPADDLPANVVPTDDLPDSPSQPAPRMVDSYGRPYQDDIVQKTGRFVGDALQSGGRMLMGAATAVPGMFADATSSAYNLIHGRDAPTLQQTAAGQKGDYPFPVLPSEDFRQRLEPALGKAPDAGTAVGEGLVSGLISGKVPLPGQAAVPAVNALTGAKMADQAGGTAGLQTGSPLLQSVERTLSRLPGGGALVRAVQGQNAKAADSTEAIVDNLSGGADTSPTGVGNVLNTQLKAAGQRMKDLFSDLYDRIEQRVPPGTAVNADNTINTLRRITTPPAGAENAGASLINPKLAAIRNGIEKDLSASAEAAGGAPGAASLPYTALKQLRTQIGDQIEWGPFSTDPANGQLKQVYHALTADLNAGAAKMGPDAAAEIKSVNTAYTANKTREEILSRVMDKAGGPEKVFTSLMATTKDGGTTIGHVLDSVDVPTRRLIAASALQRMGRATAGAQDASGQAFSADTFLTNWNRMSPEAKAKLFNTLPDSYSSSINQLAQNISRLKAYSKVLGNSSNTAQVAVWTGEASSFLTLLLTGHPMAAGGIAASAGATKLLATALTNPQTAKYLAKQSATYVAKVAAGTTGATSADSLYGSGQPE